MRKNIAFQYKIPKPISVVRAEDYKNAVGELILAGYNDPEEILKMLGKENTKNERYYTSLFRKRFLGLVKY